MANITEQDVVFFLKEKAQNLTEELKKIHEALEVLKGTPAARAQRTAREQPIVREQTPLRAAYKREKPVPGNSQKRVRSKRAPLQAPAEFDPNGTLYTKIAFALSQTGPAFKEDIVKRLGELQPELKNNAMKAAIFQRLSFLKGNGLIDAEKVGRKRKYSLLDT